MLQSPGEDTIFLLTKDEILACAYELGIPQDKLTEDVIEQVKERIISTFSNWPEIIKKTLMELIVTGCPLGLVCYPSCFWWQDGKCTFPRQD